MLEDSDDRELQRAIRRTADEDIAAFLAGLEAEDTGVPPPPQIKISEVNIRPAELDLIGFGGQDAGTKPGPVGPPVGPSVPVCCAGASLVCDSINASRDKCGFFENAGYESDPPKVYLSQYDYHHFTVSDVSGFTSSFSNFYRDTYYATDPDTCDEADPIQTCSGSTRYIDTLGHCLFGCDVIDDDCDCSGAASGCSSPCAPTLYSCTTIPASCLGDWTNTHVITGSTDISTNDWNNTYPCQWDGTDESGTILSDEYTTSLLITSTESDLPAYSGCWNCVDEDGNPCSLDEGQSCECSSSRDLSENELSYSIRRAQYKFTFGEPLEEECDICWIERTYDADGNPVEDNHMCETVLVGESESTVYELLEPAENGTISVIYPIGVCCNEGACTVTDAYSCATAGGDYQGDSCSETPCSPNPCT